MRSLLLASLLGAVCMAAPSLASQDAAKAGQRQTIAGVEVIGEGNACVQVRSIDGWKAVDRKHVILEGPGDARYLTRYSGTCFSDPRFELRIGVQSRSLRLCGGAGDYLLIDGERCMVLDIWALPPVPKRTALTP